MFHPSENSLHPYGAYALWAATAIRDHKSINQSDFAVSLRSELRRCQLLCGVREPPHTKDPHGPGSEGAGPMPRCSSAAFGHLPPAQPKTGKAKAAAAAVRFDESVALHWIEPLHRPHRRVSIF